MEYGGEGCEFVSMYRQNTGQPWGFRMMGGRDQGCCLYIGKKPVELSASALSSGLLVDGAVRPPADDPDNEQQVVARVEQVKANSLSHKYGLRAGDAVLQIGQVPALHLNHDQAKAEMLRAGNDLHLLVQRGAVQVEVEPEPVKERAQVVEEETQYRGDRNPKGQSRSFRIISESLVEEMNTLPGGQQDPYTANATPFR